MVLIIGVWAIPLIAGLLIYAHRKRCAAAKRFFDPAMGQRLMPSTGPVRPWLRGITLIVAVALLIVAAARPRFGTEEVVVARHGVDLMVCLDVSRSMLAEDIAPSRLERAKDDIRELTAAMPGERYGLILFAGRPFSAAPLTSDLGYFQQELKDAAPHRAMRGGTNLSAALQKALDALPENQDRDQAIILVTDGDNLEGEDPIAIAKEAADRGVKIFTIGLGNNEDGALIPIREDGKITHVKQGDRRVWSKMNETLLTQISETTGVTPLIIGTKYYDFDRFESDFISTMKRGELDETVHMRRVDRYQWFLGLAVVLLLIPIMIPEVGSEKEQEQLWQHAA